METLKLKELKNGRLAMMGVASIATAHVIPGSVPLWGGLFAHRDGGLCGETPVAVQPPVSSSKTAAHYSTATIFASMVWSKTGIKAGDLAPKQLKAVQITGVDCLVGKTEGGKIFVVQNNCPHFGTPLSTGANVIGNAIVCPLHGSAFDVFSSKQIEVLVDQRARKAYEAPYWKGLLDAQGKN